MKPSKDKGTMMQSESIAALAASLSKAQSSLDHAVKDTANPFFKSKYADLTACIDASRPHLTANGLAVMQTTDIRDGQTVLITTLAHQSGEWIKSIYPINPVKADPQGIGSAITYARRYSYQAIIGLAAEDDDGNAASHPPKTRPAPVTQVHTPPAQPVFYSDAEFNEKFNEWAKGVIEGRFTVDKLATALTQRGKSFTPQQIQSLKEATV